MVQVALIIGSNLDDKRSFLDKAVASLKVHLGTLTDLSSIYVSPPWGYESSNEYYNQVLLFQTKLTAEHVLSFCLRIENLLGRKRTTNGSYQDRTIDIDILYYGDQVIDSEQLHIPHPRMHQRKFCLLPLFEVNPDWIHPVLGTDMISLIESCEDNTDLKRLS